MIRGLAATAVMAAAGVVLASLGARFQPGLPPAQSKHGVRVKVHTFGARVQIQDTGDAPRVYREIEIGATITFPQVGLVVEPIEIVKLTDPAGKDLLAGAERQGIDPMTRQSLVGSMGVFEGTMEPTAFASGRVWGLQAIPARIGELRARIRTVHAGGIVKATFPADIMDKPGEPVPGVRFLVSKVGERDGYVRVGFEAHMDRDKSVEAPLDAPFIAAVHALDESGTRLVTLRTPGEVTTREAYIISVEDWSLDRNLWNRIKAFEVWIIKDLRRVEFEVEMRGVGFLD